MRIYINIIIIIITIVVAINVNRNAHTHKYIFLPPSRRRRKLYFIFDAIFFSTIRFANRFEICALGVHKYIRLSDIYETNIKNAPFVEFIRDNSNVCR